MSAEHPAAYPYDGRNDERNTAGDVGEGGHSAVEAEAAAAGLPASAGREVARPDVPDPVARSGSAAQGHRNTPEQNQEAINHYNRPCVCGHPWSGHSLLDPDDDKVCLDEDCSCPGFREWSARRRKPWQADPRLDHPFVMRSGDGRCETCGATRAEHEAERLALVLERIGAIAEDHPEGEDWRIIREITDEVLYADTY